MPSWRQISRKASALGEPGTQPVAVARHRLRADGVQRHQDVIVPASETADPVLGRTCSGIADQLRSLRGSFDEHTKGLERQRWDAFFDLQRDQSGPRDADVEAIVGRATRGIGKIVSRPGREPHMPVRGSRDLRDVGFVTADEPSELPARLCRSSDRQQEMPHHRHRVAAENEPLNVREVERRPVPGPGIAIAPWVFMRPSTEQSRLNVSPACVYVFIATPNSGDPVRASRPRHQVVVCDSRSASRALMSWTERPG